VTDAAREARCLRRLGIVAWRLRTQMTVERLVRGFRAAQLQRLETHRGRLDAELEIVWRQSTVRAIARLDRRLAVIGHTSVFGADETLLNPKRPETSRAVT
jgi:hypothetical protein